MRPLRICVIYDCLYPYTVGGAERWYRNLAERLAAAGHDVTYLTMRQWDRGQQLDLDPRVNVLAVAPRMQMYVAGRRRILPALVFGLGVLTHLLRHRRRYDVVHTAATPLFSILAAGAARPVGRYRLVVDWHEIWSLSYWREYLGPVGGRIAYGIQLLCTRIPQRAFCFSRLHANRLRAEGLRGEVSILEGEYAGSLETPTPVAAEPVVLFAARLIPEKRASLALAAFAESARRIPDLRMELYGDGPERDDVLGEIQSLGIGDVVQAPGFVDSQRIDERMRRSLCVLSTSRREGYGMVVVEAAARATPSIVIADEDNASMELIDDGVNGFVVAEPHPKAVADAIEQVHEGGLALRQSTADWFAANAMRLSLESSLTTVLASYERDATPAADRPS